MRKFLVGLFVAAWMSSVAYAGCKTTQATIGFNNAESFTAFDTVANVSQAQAWKMMERFVMEGKAIIIPSGMTVNDIKKINEYISIIEINGVAMIVVSSHVRCR